jgi:hypothetical protein
MKHLRNQLQNIHSMMMKAHKSSIQTMSQFTQT